MQRKAVKLPDTFYQDLEARAFALERNDGQMAGMLRKIQYLLQNATKKGNNGTVGY